MLRTAFLSLAVLCGAQAIAADVNPANPESVASALQDFGYRATIDTDGVGDPMIRTSGSGVDYVIYFYGCSDNKNCEDMHFVLGLDLEDGYNLEELNAWNSTNLVGSAYLDDEMDPYLRLYVVSKGGLKKETFEEVVNLWTRSMGRFMNHVGFSY